MILSVVQKILYEKNIRDFIEKKGGRLDSNWRYLNYSTKIPITCEKGHKWNSLWCHIKRNHWCPECAGQVVHEKDVRAHIEGKGGMLEPDWKYKNKCTKFKVTCERGHIWFPVWNDLKYNGSWCPYCSKHIVDVNLARDYIINKKGFLEKDWKYIDSTTKFWITCEKGHRWETCWNVVQSDHWCPHCQKFKREQEFRETIEKYFGEEKFPSKKPKWLRYPPTKRPLQLDGYNENKKIAFEYQGLQHYELCFVNRYSEERLKDIQKRDLFKEEICQQQGVVLIAVPYWISKDNWEGHIQSSFNNHLI